MSAEVHRPGLESAALAQHYEKRVKYLEIFYDDTNSSREQLQVDIGTGLTMTVIREKLSIGMNLTAREMMIFEGIKRPRRELPLAG